MGTAEEEIHKESGSFLGEFKEGVIGKFKNPFFFTFIIVWIIHNWIIVYSFFYFDEKSTLSDKIFFFEKYWKANKFWINLLEVFIYSVIALIISYFIFWITSYLIGYYKFNLLPKAIKKTRGEVVTLKEYEDVLNKRSEYYSLYRTAQKEAIESSSEKNSIEKMYLELKQENEKTKSDYQILISDKEILEQKLNSKDEEIDKILENEKYSREKVEIFANFSNFMKSFSLFVDDLLPLNEKLNSIGLNKKDIDKLLSYFPENISDEYRSYKKDNIDNSIEYLSPLGKFFLLFNLSKSDLGQHPFLININNIDIAESLEKKEFISRINLLKNKDNIITYEYTEKGRFLTIRLLISFLEGKLFFA